MVSINSSNVIKISYGETNYSYDAMGRINERILPSGVRTHYELNPLGHITSLTHKDGDNILDSLKYTHDRVGNITRIEKYRRNIESDSGIFDYAYNPKNQLISAINGDYIKQYGYDEVGNRISEIQNGIEKKHIYNKLNQLIRTKDGENTDDYRYDGRGNLTEITRNGLLKSKYSFDATNMMTEAINVAKGNVKYTYDGFRNRVRKLEQFASPETLHANQLQSISPDKEIRYILDMTLPYDNLLTIQTKVPTTSDMQHQNFVWGEGLISSSGKSSESNFFYLHDHLSSPIRLIGMEEDHSLMAYDEFGVPKIIPRQDIEHFNNPFGFTGYQPDDITGLNFAQARYYNPNVGRFTAEDTHWHPENMLYGDYVSQMPHGTLMPNIDAVMQSSNVYNYCTNNPLRYIDPTGRCEDDTFGDNMNVNGNQFSNLGFFWNSCVDVANIMNAFQKFYKLNTIESRIINPRSPEGAKVLRRREEISKINSRHARVNGTLRGLSYAGLIIDVAAGINQNIVNETPERILGDATGDLIVSGTGMWTTIVVTARVGAMGGSTIKPGLGTLAGAVGGGIAGAIYFTVTDINFAFLGDRSIRQSVRDGTNAFWAHPLFKPVEHNHQPGDVFTGA